MKKALFALLVSFCACASVQPNQYFTISLPEIEGKAQGATPNPHPVRLRVTPFQGALPYDRPEIVYRSSPFMFQYYSSKLWASKPQHLLREVVLRYLQTKGIVMEVSLEYGDQLPDYELSGEVVAIEEFDSGDLWFAHLAMRFSLVRFSDKVRIWQYSFDKRRTVFRKEPMFVVKAMSEILQEELQNLATMVDRAIAEDRNTNPVLGGEAQKTPEKEKVEQKEDEEIIKPED